MVLRHFPANLWRSQIPGVGASELRVHLGAVLLYPKLYTSGSWTSGIVAFAAHGGTGSRLVSWFYDR